MQNIRKVIVASFLCAIMAGSAVSTNAGVIVNLQRQEVEKQCVDSKSDSGVKFDRGVIVNLTGVIVNFTGVIVNLTGVIVNYTNPSPADCGHIPTSD